MDGILEELIVPYLKIENENKIPHLAYLSEKRVIPRILTFRQGKVYTEHINGYRLNKILEHNSEIMSLLKYDEFEPKDVKNLLNIYEKIGSVCCFFNKIGVQHNDFEASNIILNQDLTEIRVIDWEYSKYAPVSFRDAYTLMKNTHIVLKDYYGDTTLIENIQSFLFESFFKGWIIEHDKILTEGEKILLSSALELSKKYKNDENELKYFDFKFI
ncbi:Choline/ethanolamine kinase [Candidatus Tiddalikarchaeum anstoanum]|nr:Choline/ethanolamine kinase [Candidatus Tiddalikarchaeum anstoanum]